MNHNGRMSARWITFLVWALVAASAAAWGLKLFVTAPGAPPQVSVAGQSQLPRGDITRVLGADAPPPVDPAAGESLAGAPADARFQLVGVLAPRGNETARNGVALIAVDGKPPRAYRVGAVVDGENVVQAIRARGADLGPSGGNVAVALNIPPPAPAATGTLPDPRAPGASGGAAAPGQARPPAGSPPPPQATAPTAFPPTVMPVPVPVPVPAARRAVTTVTGAPPMAQPLQPLQSLQPVPMQPAPRAAPAGPGQLPPMPSPGGPVQPQTR